MKTKRGSTKGVGDALGSRKLAPVPEQQRYQKVPALAKPLGARGRRPRVDHASLGVGDDPMTSQITAGLAVPKQKALPLPGKAKKGKAAGLKIIKEKPGKGARNPEAPRAKIVKLASVKSKPGVAVMGLSIRPRKEEGPSSLSSPLRAERIEPAEPLAARGGKEPAFQPRPGALAATPYSPQMVILGIHRLVPHSGSPIPGKGNEKPEFEQKKPVGGGKR